MLKQYSTAEQERIRQAEGWMQEAFGTDHRSYTRRLRAEKLSVYVSEAIRVLDHADVRALVHAWKLEDGKTSNRGRKRFIDEYAALAILLIQMRYSGVLLFTHMVETLTCLNAVDLSRLGIHHHDVDDHQWYDRLWRAYERLQSLIDEFPGNRKKKPTRDAFNRIIELRDPEKMAVRHERFLHLTNALIEGSISFLPRELRRRYGGNIAIDATFTKHNGKLGGQFKKKLDAGEKAKARAAGLRTDFKLVGDHNSINYDGGWYVRQGDHDGMWESALTKRFWGIETELATWVPNAPGAETKEYPLLISAITFHKPGELSGAAGEMIRSILSRQYPIDHFMADRAYLPSSKPEDLQGPLARLGSKVVFDYKTSQKGIQASYDHAIQVEGQWYLKYMPLELTEAEALYSEAKADAFAKIGIKNIEDEPDADDDQALATSDADARLKTETKRLIELARTQRDQRLAAREKYRLKPKGRRRPNGSRQYMYPNPELYNETLFDPETAELLDVDIPATVVIPFDVGVKYGQEYKYRSEKWHAYYGLRNVVESQNAYIKDSSAEDIGSAMNRRARGNTFAALAATLAVVSANIRRILTFIKDALAVVARTAKNQHSQRTYHSIFDLDVHGFGRDLAEDAPPQLT